VHRLYGVAEQALVLVRPDGYVGFRSSPASPSALHSYLERTLSLLPSGTAVTDGAEAILRNHTP
jgi:hypothetical protein